MEQIFQRKYNHEKNYNWEILIEKEKDTYNLNCYEEYDDCCDYGNSGIELPLTKNELIELLESMLNSLKNPTVKSNS